MKVVWEVKERRLYKLYNKEEDRTFPHSPFKLLNPTKSDTLVYTYKKIALNVLKETGYLSNI